MIHFYRIKRYFKSKRYDILKSETLPIVHYYQKNVFYLEICIAADTKILKFQGGQYMSAETETQYNPQYGVRRTIFRMNMIF